MFLLLYCCKQHIPFCVVIVNNSVFIELHKNPEYSNMYNSEVKRASSRGQQRKQY